MEKEGREWETYRLSICCRDHRCSCSAALDVAARGEIGGWKTRIWEKIGPPRRKGEWRCFEEMEERESGTSSHESLLRAIRGEAVEAEAEAKVGEVLR